MAFIKHKGRKRRKARCHGGEGTMFWCPSYLCDLHAWDLGSSWQKLASNSTRMSENWGQISSTSLRRRNDQPTNTVIVNRLYDIFWTLRLLLLYSFARYTYRQPFKNLRGCTCLDKRHLWPVWSGVFKPDLTVLTRVETLLYHKKRKKEFTET